jgi:hypothetical protein
MELTETSALLAHTPICARRPAFPLYGLAEVTDDQMLIDGRL